MALANYVHKSNTGEIVRIFTNTRPVSVFASRSKEEIEIQCFNWNTQLRKQ